MRRYISFLLLILVLRRVFDPMKTKARVLLVLLFYLFLLLRLAVLAVVHANARAQPKL